MYKKHKINVYFIKENVNKLTNRRIKWGADYIKKSQYFWLLSLNVENKGYNLICA